MASKQTVNVAAETPKTLKVARAAVTAVEMSGNEKIGFLSATYASIDATCGDACPLKANGCYARGGHVGRLVGQLDRAAARDMATANDCADMEAAAIDGLTGRFPLRIHVSGDVTSDYGAQALAGAAARYSARHGQKVFTYTHSFRTIARESFGSISVLASCETADDVQLANARGYAAAIVVGKHKQATAYVENGVRMIPCPQQTGRAKNCEACGLCMRAGNLSAGAAIAFEAHGQSAKKVQAKLIQISMA